MVKHLSREVVPWLIIQSTGLLPRDRKLSVVQKPRCFQLLIWLAVSGNSQWFQSYLGPRGSGVMTRWILFKGLNLPKLAIHWHCVLGAVAVGQTSPRGGAFGCLWGRFITDRRHRIAGRCSPRAGQIVEAWNTLKHQRLMVSLRDGADVYKAWNRTVPLSLYYMLYCTTCTTMICIQWYIDYIVIHSSYNIHSTYLNFINFFPFLRPNMISTGAGSSQEGLCRASFWIRTNCTSRTDTVRGVDHRCGDDLWKMLNGDIFDCK